MSKFLKRHSGPDPHDGSFDYRSVVGNLRYLEKGSRPNIEYTVQKCTIFTPFPKKEHAQALRWLGRYLRGTQDKVKLLRPNTVKYLEVYVDANFAGNWDKYHSLDRDTERSRNGYIIMYTGCPVVWKS